MQADTLEQLGYQSENTTWRNAYLTGAQALEQGRLTVAGDGERVAVLFGLLDTFEPSFNIVTPPAQP